MKQQQGLKNPFFFTNPTRWVFGFYWVFRGFFKISICSARCYSHQMNMKQKII